MTGVIGVLLRAKEVSRLEAVIPLLYDLREAGYWLSDEIIEHAGDLANEAIPDASDGDDP